MQPPQKAFRKTTEKEYLWWRSKRFEKKKTKSQKEYHCGDH